MQDCYHYIYFYFYKLLTFIANQGFKQYLDLTLIENKITFKVKQHRSQTAFTKKKC